MQALTKSKIFQGLDPGQIKDALACLNFSTLDLKKKSSYYNDRDNPLACVLASGLVDLVEINEEGRCNILARYGVLDSLVLDPYYEEGWSLEIKEDSRIVLVDIAEIYNPKKSKCKLRTAIMENLIKVLHEQNEKLSTKVNICTASSLRDKIMSYLGYLQEEEDSDIVDLSFTREDLASYLACNRSALSRELSKMEDDKIIRFDRNKVQILK